MARLVSNLWRSSCLSAGHQAWLVCLLPLRVAALEMVKSQVQMPWNYFVLKLVRGGQRHDQLMIRSVLSGFLLIPHPDHESSVLYAFQTFSKLKTLINAYGIVSHQLLPRPHLCICSEVLHPLLFIQIPHMVHGCRDHCRFFQSLSSTFPVLEALTG